ncbi:MAG: fatty acid desaturase [Candidatus Omnitrophica bacterium]|nr:fatty acid desaturase [Candidatus Omnitrophota bacterium]
MAWRNARGKGFSGSKAEVLRIPGVGGIAPLPVSAVQIEAGDTTLALVITIPLWIAYTVIASILWLNSVWLGLFFIAVCGQYLVSWMGYMRHELWHNYFPGVNNSFFFKLISYLLFSDPKVYEIAHVTHHRDLHTVRDLEFCCAGYKESRFRRRLQFVLEILFGNIAWETAAVFRLTTSGQMTAARTVWSLSLRLAILSGLCFLSDAVFPGAGKVTAYVYLLTIWFGAVMTRHDQWIEHLGIVTEAPLAERIRLTRNLPNSHWTNKLWNLFNHNDPRGHYYHHAYPQLNLRDFTELELPAEVPKITIPQYLEILWKHYGIL